MQTKDLEGFTKLTRLGHGKGSSKWPSSTPSVVVKCADANRGGKPTLVFNLRCTKALAQQLRWLAKDRVDLSINEAKRQVLIERVPKEGAYSLKGGGAAARAKGATSVAVETHIGIFDKQSAAMGRWIRSEYAEAKECAFEIVGGRLLVQL